MDMNKNLLVEKIKKFPKTDLHRHLEGSILPETFVEIARTYGGELPAYEVETLRPLIQVVDDPPGFHNFLNKFKVLRCFYPCLEAVEEIAFRAVQNAADDGAIPVLPAGGFGGGEGERGGAYPHPVTISKRRAGVQRPRPSPVGGRRENRRARRTSLDCRCAVIRSSFIRAAVASGSPSGEVTTDPPQKFTPSSNPTRLQNSV